MQTNINSFNNIKSENINLTHLLNKGSKGKILIIDDDIIYSQKLKAFLEQYNYEVISANSGCNGIYKSIVYKPDIIICEISLPDFDGFSLQRELNRYKSIIKSKFIYMSYYSLSFFIREAMDLGAEKFLTKPVNSEFLLNVLSQILNNVKGTDDDNGIKSDLLNNELSLNANLPNQNISVNPTGFQYVDPNKVKINFNLDDYKLKNNASKDPFSINRNELNDFEKLNFNDLTLIIVNMSIGDQKVAVSFRDFLFPIISQDPKKILIDLSQITYMDSAFTGVLVEASKRFKLYSHEEVKLVLDVKNSSINPFIVEWVIRNFKTYDNINYAVSCLEELPVPENLLT